MKIIQSFWSANNHDIFDSKGWFSAKYHWLSWVLSANQLRKYHEEVELYTDEFGYKILIETLQLPYTKVHVVLDKLNIYSSGLWALAKVEAYSLCKTPFIHVDGDVFVWENLTNKFNKAELVVQNLEHTTEYYRTMWKNITEKITTIPNEMQNFHENKSNNAYNMGIFGGNDIDFISYYTKLSYEFVNNNKDFLKDIDLFNFNIFFEQVLFYELATQKNKKVEVLIHEDIGDNEYRGFADFERVPTEKTYLHLLGVFKKNEIVCNKLESYILKYYPEYIYKLKALIPSEYSFFDFEYKFTTNENVKLISNYTNLVKQNKEIEINNSNLFSRDIFMQNQIQLFEMNMNNLQNVFLHLLKEFNIDKSTNVVKIFELENKETIFEIDELDEIFFEELKMPINYIDFEQKIISYLEDDFLDNNIESFKNIIYERVIYFINYKLLSINLN